jgi:hypothetical protein
MMARLAPAPPELRSNDEIDDPSVQLPAVSMYSYMRRLLTAFVGSHGIFSHFPVMLFGLAGIGAVMHRHWQPWTKTLAAISRLGATTIVSLYCLLPLDWKNAMFASRWFVVFLPLLLFWAGAWARREHRRLTWLFAASLWVISSTIALIGATDPYPENGFDRYTAAAAVKRLFHGQADATHPQDRLASVNLPP